MSRTATTVLQPKGHLIVLWAMGGVSILLAQAIVRLAEQALIPMLDARVSLSPAQIVLYVGWAALNLYLEGYRAFHQRWCPRVAQRAYYLARYPRAWSVALAPAFVMSFFHASRRSQTVAWVMLVFVVACVAAVRLLPQPWRGIIDGGVVLALVWGLVSLWYNYARWLGGEAPLPDDLP